MLDRRSLLTTVAASSALAACSRTQGGANHAGGEPAKLNAAMDAIFQEGLANSPESATDLGLDKGPGAAAKSRLDDRSLAGVAADKRRSVDQLARIRTVNRSRLSGLDAVNYDVVEDQLKRQVEADRQFDFATTGTGAPYVLSQLTGAYQSIPDFLDSRHGIETAADCEAYLSRLDAFATTLDQEVECARADAAKGIVPPDFVLSKTLTQMTGLRDQKTDASVLVQSLARRAREKGIAGDWAGRAGQIYTTKVQPALDRQVALVRGWQSGASHDAGVWRLPGGDAYYAASLRNSTTTGMSPQEVHQTGLDLIRTLSEQIHAGATALGVPGATAGEQLKAMYADPKYRYANTDAAKERLIEDLNAKVRVVQARLPEFFGTLPKGPVVIRRVPKYIEAGAPGGYYQQPPLDGSRPGTYYINLRDTAEVPKWTLSTLTYHEGIPGHHLQLALQTEAALPQLRKQIWLSAYGEGWALYAEQLADEMGMYANDAPGRIGYLHDAMFRAARLVVDTGMHAMHWSREQAVKFFVDTLGDQESGAITEIERYCVWPGQACSYMVGKLTWLRLRERSRQALGSKFDLKAFHDSGLLSGPMPLDVLDRHYAEWTTQRSRA